MFSLLTTPLHDILVFFAQSTGDLGVAIVLLTLVVRLALVPLTVPSQKQQLKNRDRMRALKPRLAELKKKYKDDKVKLNQAQVDLYREHNIQLFSWSTLLPFVQIIFLIALYNVLLTYLRESPVDTFSATVGLDLTVPDPTYVLPILAGGLQLILSAMLLPGFEHHDVVEEKADVKKKNKKKSLKSELNEDETDMQEQAEQMSQQMLFIMPIITGFFAAKFPAGVALYWVATTLFSLVQQYFISGPGGLITIWNKARQIAKKE